MKITAKISRIKHAAISAAKKMFAFGINEYVPSSFSTVSAFYKTAAPIAGPIIPGTRTCPTIRSPWNIPARFAGV